MKTSREEVVELPVSEIYKVLSSPAELCKILEGSGSFKAEKIEGSYISSSIIMLGQRFRIRFRHSTLDKGLGLELSAVESPFRKFEVKTLLEDLDGKAKIRDIIEVKSGSSPITDALLCRAMTAILSFRNRSIEEAYLKGLPGPSYRPAMSFGVIWGVLLSAGMVILGALLVYAYALLSGLLGFIAAAAGLVLIWFWSHDLAHVLVGYLAGVRFSYYYLGLSNIYMIGSIPASVRLSAVALGVKIDRGRSRATYKGYAAMYLAGPMASMIIPLIASALLFSSSGDIPSAILLLVSIINVAFTSYFSPKVGCIAKAARQIRLA